MGLGQSFPDIFQVIARTELAKVNFPVGFLICKMIIPMLIKVGFTAPHVVRQHIRGIGVTLLVNWVIKPFTKTFLGWLFIRSLSAPILPLDQIDNYIAGDITCSNTLHRHGICVEPTDLWRFRAYLIASRTE